MSRCWDLIAQLKVQRSLEGEHFASVRGIMQREYFATLQENEALQARVSDLEGAVARQRSGTLLARACSTVAECTGSVLRSSGAAQSALKDALRSVGDHAGTRLSGWLSAACDALLTAPPRPSGKWAVGARLEGVRAFECGQVELFNMDA